MAKNSNLTHLDPNQIATLEYDSLNDAKRVIIVGGEKIDMSIDQDKLINAVKEGLSNIRFENVQEAVPTVPLAREIQTIEKNIFIPQIEIREIEKQVFIPQIEYKTIEVPVIIEKIVTVEKPIVIKEIEFREIVKERYYPKVMQICAVVQAIGVIALLIINLLKK